MTINSEYWEYLFSLICIHFVTHIGIIKVLEIEKTAKNGITYTKLLNHIPFVTPSVQVITTEVQQAQYSNE